MKKNKKEIRTVSASELGVTHVGDDHFIRILGFDHELHLTRDNEGNWKLALPFASISDIHLFTKYSRSKLLFSFLRRFSVDKLVLLGDIVDPRDKETWNFAQWQRQVVAQFLRMAKHGTEIIFVPGNHDAEIRPLDPAYPDNRKHRNLCGKIVKDICGVAIKGIFFVEEAFHTDPRGRLIWMSHGDGFDVRAFGKFQKPAYAIGNAALQAFYELDDIVRLVPRWEHVSVAAWVKEKNKEIIEKFMNTGHEMTRQLYEKTHNGRLVNGIYHGHRHMPSIGKITNLIPKFKTVHLFRPAQKKICKFILQKPIPEPAPPPPDREMLVVDDGHCTENVSLAGHDRHGVHALYKVHKNYLVIEDENKNEIKIAWATLYMTSLLNDIEPIEDECTKLADRWARMIYRIWPPKDRQKLKHDYDRGRAKIQEFAQTPLPNHHYPKQPMRQKVKSDWVYDWFFRAWAEPLIKRPLASTYKL